MKEEFLHYLWKNNLYDKSSLKDEEGNLITVIHPGEYNHDSGPDFFNARIKIGNTLWAGNVEIHVLSSHYYAHGHHKDPSYDNVILHVVSGRDKKVFNSRNDEILTVELKFPPELYESYLNLINNPCTIACQDHLAGFDQLMLRNWLSVISVERLERKISNIVELLKETENDWDEILYRMIGRYFGFRTNSDPFEMLSRNMPSKIIRKHSGNIFQVEALLFGAAGLLEESIFPEAVHDEYYKSLIKEFRILSSKYSITPMHGWIWKFSRLRPVNFPTIRISQLAHLMNNSNGLFSRALECNSLEKLKGLTEVSASEYWKNHYVFGKKSATVSRNTGRQAGDILIINAIIPVLFTYGKLRGNQELCERSVDFLEMLEPETNKIIREWETAGLKPGSAFISQALIQLRNEYCTKRKCIECHLGEELIREGKDLRNHNELILEPQKDVARVIN